MKLIKSEYKTRKSVVGLCDRVFRVWFVKLVLREYEVVCYFIHLSLQRADGRNGYGNSLVGSIDGSAKAKMDEKPLILSV